MNDWLRAYFAPLPLISYSLAIIAVCSVIALLKSFGVFRR
jgi:hypothetical protein